MEPHSRRNEEEIASRSILNPSTFHSRLARSTCCQRPVRWSAWAGRFGSTPEAHKCASDCPRNLTNIPWSAERCQPAIPAFPPYLFRSSGSAIDATRHVLSLAIGAWSARVRARVCRFL